MTFVLLRRVFIFSITAIVTMAPMAQANVFIHEVAWMGTATSANAEWIELAHDHGMCTAIDLTGWHLRSTDGGLDITLSGTLADNGFVLLERTSDDSVPDLAATVIYSGSLSNAGEALELVDAAGQVVDTADFTTGWPAGDNTTKQTMERAANGQWQTSANPGGTPGTTNSAGAALIPTPDPTPTPSPSPSPTPTTRPAGQPGSVIVNELVSDPTDGQAEWIELYNTTDQLIDITDWSVVDGSNRATTIHETITAHGYLVMTAPLGQLNNSGDIVILRDHTQAIINQMTYGSWDDGNLGDNAPVASDGHSLAWNGSQWLVNTTPTPGTTNVIVIETPPVTEPTPTSTPPITPTSTPPIVEPELSPTSTPPTTEILPLMLSEILPDPEGSDDQEFIEIYNPNNQPVDLTGWQLDDGPGGSKAWIWQTGTIAADAYLVIPYTESRVILNNSSDHVILTDSLGVVRDQLDYTTTITGQSYSRTPDNQWQWTPYVTPGTMNDFAPDDSGGLETATVDDLKDMPANSKENVTVTGTVIVTPGTLWATRFFLDGLPVYFSSGNEPQLQTNDIVRISGRVTMRQNQPTLTLNKESEVVVIDQQPLELTPTAIDLLTPDQTNQLVQISGMVSKRTKTSLTLEDGATTITVTIRPNTGIVTTSYNLGATITVTGLLLAKTDESFTVYPRHPDDLQVTAPAPTTSTTTPTVAGASTTPTKPNPWSFVWLGTTASVIAGGRWWHHRRRRQSQLTDPIKSPTIKSVV